MLTFVALAVWSVIGPGGGGAQFLPTVSPHDPRTVLARCDMTGAYITNDAGGSWRMFNLRGVVSFFVFDPRDRKVIYAGSTGLYRSADAGRTWSLVYPDPADLVRIDMPDDHAGERFVLKDGKSRRATALAVDPADSNTLYAAIAEDGALSLRISRDQGKTWSKVTGLDAAILRIHVNNGAVYAIGAGAVTVCRGGECERRSTPGGFTDVSAAARVIYATASKGVYVSEDGGAGWRRAEFEGRAVAVATTAVDPKVVYVSYTGPGRDAFGVARSADSGRTWDYVWKEGSQPAPNVHGGWLSERFGPWWGGEPLSLGVAPTDANICYATNLGATLRTTDGGKTWHGVYSRKAEDGGYTTNGMDVTTTYGVHFDPFDARRIFISYTDIGLFGSENGGASWHSYSRTVPRRWVNTTYWMEFDPEVKGRVWAVMSGVHDLPRPKMFRRRSTSTYNGGVTVSDDGGRTWRVAGESLPPSAVTCILLDPTSPKESRTLYITAFGRGVYKSTDGGETWEVKNAGIEGDEPFAWWLTRDPEGVLYLVVARRREDGVIGTPGDGALYRSRDGAGHWERIALPEGVNGPNGLTIDRADPKRLHLSVWGRPSPAGATDGGIYLSADAGATWRRVLARDQHIYDVTTDPREPETLYACGFENSAWRSTDRGETWKRIPGYNFKWGHRVVPDPHHAGMIYITTFGGSVWYGPATGDPEAVEDIATRLPDR